MTPPPGWTSESEPFELLETLGSGGFATTYKARVLDEDLAEAWGCNIVAIIVPLGRKQERLLAKQVEMNGLLHIQAANIVPYLGLCVFHGQIVLAKQFIPGGSLRGMIGSVGVQKPLPLDQAIEIAEGTLAGLAAIHRRRILHRDIKPENILMDGRVPKIDPGFLWVLDSNEQASVTGTLFYMSPELLDMEGASFRSDIWSFGVTLYEMVTGVIPFGDMRAPVGVILDNIRRAEIRPPRELRPDIPEELDRIIMKALERPLERRFRTADEMLEDLRAWRHGTTSEANEQSR